MTTTSPNIEQELQHKSIIRLLLQYSGPAVIASVATSLYNVVDSVFIGHGVGAMALAALAIALPLMNLNIAFCTIISVGGPSITSIFLGKKDHESAEITLNNVVLLCIVHAIVFGGLMLVFLDPILYLFGATSATIVYARDYMEIILLATPISYLFIGLNDMMRATGYPKKAMLTAFITVAFNVVLCPLFVFVCKWGIRGAAVATVLSQFVGLVWCALHFLSKKSLVRFNPKLPWVRKDIVKKTYGIGISPFLMNVCACVVVVFLNRSLLTVGGMAGNFDVGAYGNLNRITMLFIMVVLGLTFGMQPILGYNYGAGQWDRVKQTLKIGIWCGVAVTTIGWILTECFPDQLSAIFTNNRELIDIDRTGFRIYFIFYPVVGAQIVIQNFFQYIDKPKYSIFLSLTRQLIFLLPFLLILPRHYGVDGVWASMAASDLLAYVVAQVVLVVMLKKFDKKYGNMPSSAAVVQSAKK